MFDSGVASGIGALGMGLKGLFGGHEGENPADKAMGYLNKIPGSVSPYYNPWIGPATGMMPGINDLYSRMRENPGEFFNKISAGYTQSPGYQKALREALGGIENAQAAGGMAGSAQHQQLAGQEAADIASKDFQQYINNILGIEGMGLQGGENTLNRGFDASKSLADILGTNLANQGNVAAKGQDWENKTKNQDWANIFSGAASILPGLFGGGSNDWKNPGSLPGWE